jgi:multiple sugar transport system permease protein
MSENIQIVGETAAQVQPQAAAPPRELSRRSRIEMVLFVVPAFLFQLLWGWYPIFVAFYLSFTDAKLRNPPTWIGLENYIRMSYDPLVVKAFQVTFTYALMSIVLTFVIPILVAILLMEMPRKVMRWMMLLWFLPLSGIASTILWRYFYNARYGLLQYVFTSLGLPEQGFLNDANLVLFWLIFPGVLLFGPGLIYMASLQSIPQSYYEAAEIEGASFWRKIWTISLPRLRPIIVMMMTFAIIGSLQEFSWPQIMTGPNGEPGGFARTVVMYIYQPIWTMGRYGDATALSVALFLVIMLITMLYRTLFKEDPDV